MCLASIVCASEPSLALEITPLPSEPQVQAGDLATFDRARDLITNYLRRLERIKVVTSLTRRESAPWPTGEIVPHDLRLAQVRVVILGNLALTAMICNSQQKTKRLAHKSASLIILVTGDTSHRGVGDLLRGSRSHRDSQSQSSVNFNGTDPSAARP